MVKHPAAIAAFFGLGFGTCEETPPRWRIRKHARSVREYSDYVNPQWVLLLYTRCEGVELQTEDERTVLDFLSGSKQFAACIVEPCSRRPGFACP